MTTSQPDRRPAVLDAARAAVDARMRADADLLAAAAEWAILHPATEVTGWAGFGDGALFGEASVPLGGDGAPLVAEFAPAELAAVLGWSTDTVVQLMADALDLRCRHPRLWDEVQDLRVPAHLARYVATQARDLDRDLAVQVDRMLAGGGKLTRTVIRRVVDEIRLHDDPDRAVAEEQVALAARRVELLPGATPATGEVAMTLDRADLERFGGTVSAIAGRLAECGDTDDLDVRRARAVGIMADPRAALELLTGDATDPRVSPGGGTAQLFLHLDLATLADLAHSGSTGAVAAETLGVATTSLVRDWLSGWLGPQARVTVRPYLDLAEPDTVQAVDGHDPTGPIADFVRLRDPHCVFPGCTVPSRRCDLDHIRPYVPPDDGGPPGQTHPDNLAPLCRRHHRVKTHAPWSYVRLPDNGYRWNTPAGHVVDVPLARR